MKVLIIGAGVVGVATAFHLNRLGVEVEVIDRRSGPGLETSFANGGQLSASHAEPWANPSTPAKIVKWLGRRDAPLLMRWRLDPALWSWAMRFLANCTEKKARANIERILRLALYSREAMAAIRSETDIEYERLEQGILHFYRDPREFDRAAKGARMMSEMGCRRDCLDAAACVALEPALAHIGPELAGGIFSPDDASGDAYLFTSRLAEICGSRGVVFRWDRVVERLETEGGRVVGALTSSGPVRTDATLVAMGSFSPLLLRPLGIRLPIYPAKGYSVTLPITNAAVAPMVSLTDDENKLVFSRLGGRLRAAGTAEMAGWNQEIDQDRADVVLRRTMEIFPGAFDPEEAVFWAGLRPKTPDSVPLIGATPVPGLFINTGHGTLGWTMSAGSGRVVADLIAGRNPDIDIGGLGVDRLG